MSFFKKLGRFVGNHVKKFVGAKVEIKQDDWKAGLIPSVKSNSIKEAFQNKTFGGISSSLNDANNPMGSQIKNQFINTALYGNGQQKKNNDVYTLKQFDSLKSELSSTAKKQKVMEESVNLSSSFVNSDFKSNVDLNQSNQSIFNHVSMTKPILLGIGVLTIIYILIKRK